MQQGGEGFGADDDVEGDAEGGAAHDADDAGVNQRVAEESLHHRAAEGEVAADEGGGERAWQAHLVEGVPVRRFFRGEGAADAVCDEGEVEAGAAEADAEDEQDGERQRSYGEGAAVVRAVQGLFRHEARVLLMSRTASA